MVFACASDNNAERKKNVRLRIGYHTHTHTRNPPTRVFFANTAPFHLSSSSTVRAAPFFPPPPPPPQTNRGTGGHIAILEEAAYINPRLVYEVVVPTLSTGCSLIAISTISADESNFLSKLVDARDGRGNSLFNVLNLRMVCNACQRRGAELTCAHMLGQLPRWQSRGRHDFIQRVMSTEEDTFLVEMRGVVADGMKQPAFDVNAVNDLMTNPEMVFTPSGADIKHLFVALDPAAGGEQSEYAVVSAFYDSADNLIMCGGEAGKYREQRSCANMLMNHIMALRSSIPGAANAKVVFIPESNLAFEALWVTDEMRRAGLGDFWRVIIEDANRAGVKTSRQLKHLMVLNMNSRIARGRVRRVSNFVSIGDSDKTPEEMQEKILVQVKEFMRKVKPPRDPHHGTPTVSYSGKDGHGKDDLCMAFLLLDMMRNRFFGDQEKYGDFW